MSGFIPYARPHWTAEESRALDRVLESGMWTGGDRVPEFERELAALTGAPTVVLSSGTAAVFALLHLLGTRSRGPRLLVTPTLTFAAAPASARFLGWDVALCDVRSDDLTIDADRLGPLLERVHRDYARIVVMPVHYAGHSCDLPAVSAVCERYGATLVEDACHAIGGRYDGEHSVPVGAWPGSLAAYYSFHPTKPVAAGEGGAVATRDPVLLEELRAFRNHNMVPVPRHTDDHSPWPYSIDLPGMNLRLSEFHAAVGLVQARRAEEARRNRARLADRYHAALAELPAVRAVPPVRRPGSAHHLFPVVLDLPRMGLGKPQLLAELRARGIGCQVHYTPLHRLPAFADTPARLRTEFPVADAVFPRLVSLPLWHGMRDTDQERVTDALADLVLRRPIPGGIR